jgi:hypothetical protein
MVVCADVFHYRNLSAESVENMLVEGEGRKMHTPTAGLGAARK